MYKEKLCLECADRLKTPLTQGETPRTGKERENLINMVLKFFLLWTGVDVWLHTHVYVCVHLHVIHTPLKESQRLLLVIRKLLSNTSKYSQILEFMQATFSDD